MKTFKQIIKLASQPLKSLVMWPKKKSSSPSMSDEAAVMWYGYNKAIDDCGAAIEAITEGQIKAVATEAVIHRNEDDDTYEIISKAIHALLTQGKGDK